MKLPTQPEKLLPVVIFVEGISDKHLLSRLIHDRQLLPVSIEVCGGGDSQKLSAVLSDLKRSLLDLDGSSSAKDVRRIAVIFDKESDEQHTKSQIEQVLATIQLPVEPAIFLMGDSLSTHGCIESLCLNAITDTKQKACAESFLECVQQNHSQPYTKAQQDKTRLLAYTLALKVFSNKPQDLIDFNHSCFDELAQFIQSLHV
jgi:hypothetical protein